MTHSGQSGVEKPPGGDGICHGPFRQNRRGWVEREPTSQEWCEPGYRACFLISLLEGVAMMPTSFVVVKIKLTVCEKIWHIMYLTFNCR